MVIIAHCMPSNLKTIHLRINCHLYVAKFKDHIASIVGGQLAKNGTQPHARGEEGTMWDPPIDSTTRLAHESTMHL